MFKSRLQELLQKRGEALPVYTSGNIDDPGGVQSAHFTAEVAACGQSFKCPAPQTTIRAAQNEAAKAALLSLDPSANPSASGDLGLRKNVLQNMAQSWGLDLPVYSIARDGPDHMPSFICTVEVAGKHFKGAAATNKKQASVNAANAALQEMQDRYPFPTSRKAAQAGGSSNGTIDKVTAQEEQGVGPLQVPSQARVEEAACRQKTVTPPPQGLNKHGEVGQSPEVTREEEFLSLCVAEGGQDAATIQMAVENLVGPAAAAQAGDDPPAPGSDVAETLPEDNTLDVAAAPVADETPETDINAPDEGVPSTTSKSGLEQREGDSTSQAPPEKKRRVGQEGDQSAGDQQGLHPFRPGLSECHPVEG
eukprot:SM000126S26298  [mRNA]  locus=s126:51888:53594:- [translate_table: standard]